MEKVKWDVRESLSIHSRADLSLVKARLRKNAAPDICCSEDLEQLILVASELCTNLINHAGEGEFILRINNEEKLIDFETRDEGPGIADVNEALVDGYSTFHSLGNGLGTVNRLMDELIITVPESGKGTRVRCYKRTGTLEEAVIRCPLEVGVATRPMPGNDKNGDSFVVKHFGSKLLVGVIDGLGHGQLAHQAAEKVRQYVTSHCAQPLQNIFSGADKACRGTRGVVMALLRFDWSHTPVEMTFASVGNIEAKFEKGLTARFPILRGIVGSNAPVPKIHTQPYPDNETLFLFSDGISSTWYADEIKSFQDFRAEEIARELLKLKSKGTDDATILVVKAKPPVQ